MDPFIGEIRPLPYNFAPVGWLRCDGSLVQISDYDVLYNLIGTTYGGDGVTTFGLPDLRGRVPMGANGSLPVGQLGGAETVTLTSSQTALHSHPLVVSSGSTSDTPVGNHPGVSQKAKVYGPASGALAADSILPNQGGSNPHDNIQPYLAVNFCISYQGVYPSPQ